MNSQQSKVEFHSLCDLEKDLYILVDVWFYCRLLYEFAAETKS